MANFAVSRGKMQLPYRTVVYGPEGIGKTTFAAQFPDPVFSDTEGGTARMDVPRFDPSPDSWAMLMQQAEFVRDNPSLCRTYIIDTADWAEKLCQKSVCDRAHKAGIEDFGYGKGYVYAAEEFGKLLNVLNEILAKGVNVVLTAHAAMRKFEQPDEMGAYDRWELKMHKLVATMIKEWADMVLFANYKTYTVKSESGKAKVQGGKRVMYAAHMPCWDAKNRDGLPNEMPFEYAQIAHLMESSHTVGAPAGGRPSDGPARETPPPEAPQAKAPEPEAPEAAGSAGPTGSAGPIRDPGIPEALWKLMQANNVRPEELMYVANNQKGYYPKGTPISAYADDFIQGWCIGMWDKVLDAIERNRADTPF